MDRDTRIMMGHYKKAIAIKNPHVMYCMDPQNVKVWYVLLHGFDGLAGEFTGGEYLARMTATGTFPAEPPEFEFLTEQGVYETETKKVCMSISKYHPQNYRGTHGMGGFAEQLMAALIGWQGLEGSMGLLTTTVEEKQRLARESINYNLACFPDIIAIVKSTYNDYSTRWE